MYPPLHWAISTVLKLSPHSAEAIPHSTEAIPHSIAFIPAMYWTISTVLNRRYMGWNTFYDSQASGYEIVEDFINFYLQNQRSQSCFKSVQLVYIII